MKTVTLEVASRAEVTSRALDAFVDKRVVFPFDARLAHRAARRVALSGPELILDDSESRSE